MKFNIRDFNKKLNNNKSAFERTNRMPLYNALISKNEKIDEIRKKNDAKML